MNGLGFHPESGGPHGAPVDSLKVLGASTYPQLEFWAPSKVHRTSDLDRFFIKEASSAAHIYRKTVSYTHLDVYKRQADLRLDQCHAALYR